MREHRITYAAHPDTTPDVELGVLATVFRLALDRHAKKEATRPGSPNDAKEKIKNDSRHQHRNT